MLDAKLGLPEEQLGLFASPSCLALAGERQEQRWKAAQQSSAVLTQMLCLLGASQVHVSFTDVTHSSWPCPHINHICNAVQVLSIQRGVHLPRPRPG